MMNDLNQTVSIKNKLLLHIRKLLFVLSISLFLTINSATAQKPTLEDFKRASNSKSTDAIPYKKMRQEARAIADEVQRSKIKQKLKYDRFERRKNNLLDDKENIEDDIEEKKEEIKKYPEIANLKKELKKLEAKLKDFEDDTLGDINDELREAAEKYKRLWNARGGLREIFSDVLREIDRAQSSPRRVLGSGAGDKDIDLLRRYLAKIEREIKGGERTHRMEENGAKATEQNFLALAEKTKR